MSSPKPGEQRCSAFPFAIVENNLRRVMMKSPSPIAMRCLIFFIPVLSVAGLVPADISGGRPGPITVSGSAETLTVRWPDESSRMWTAEFSLNSEKPLSVVAPEDRSNDRGARLSLAARSPHRKFTRDHVAKSVARMGSNRIGCTQVRQLVPARSFTI